jgi:membrane associated rhomboid family serine protease
MNRSPFAQATARLGPGLKAVLGIIAVVGLLEAVLVNWVGFKEAWEFLVCTPGTVLRGQLWRLVTAGVLTDITHPAGLVFTLLGLYFLSPDLETRWGTRRFVWFLVLSVVAGNLLAIAVDRVAPDSLGLLHPFALYGAGAALVGTAIAWGVNNRDAQVNLMMVLPVRGQTLVYITIGGCFLYLLYQGDVEGFGGVITGLTLVGEPSALRRGYLRLKLAFLRARSGQPQGQGWSGGGRVTAADIVRSKGPMLKKPRGDRPPLRVVEGGQGRHGDDDGDKSEKKKSEPPKDKRYLN